MYQACCSCNSEIMSNLTDLFFLFLSQQCLPSKFFGVIPLKENKEIISGCDVGSRRDTREPKKSRDRIFKAVKLKIKDDVKG